jgi:hypothetical protein
MFFLSASGLGAVRSLQESLGTERILWTGRCAVAEYAFDEPASLPRWTLPEETGVVVTETRAIFVDPSAHAGGELHWLWPQHLRVQPGNRDTGRSATVTQIQLVCNGPEGAFPALVFAGGDLATVGDADRLANVLRQSIARFRVEHSGELGLAAPQARMLSRSVIGPEFNNYQGGEGQTVTLLGSMLVEGPIRTLEAESISALPAGEEGWGQPDDAAAWEQATNGADWGRSAAGAAQSGTSASWTQSADETNWEQPATNVWGQPANGPDWAQPAGGPAQTRPGDPATWGQSGTGWEPGNGAGREQTAEAGAWRQPGDSAGWEQESFLGEHMPQEGYAAGRYGEHEPHPYADYQAAPAFPRPPVMPAPHPLPALQPQPLPARAVRAPEPEYTDLASRAADLAARVASLVSANAGAEQSLERYETQTTNLSAFLAEGEGGPGDGQPGEGDGYPTSGDEGRAEAARRTAARFAGNSARARAAGQRAGDDDHSTRQRNS